MMRRLLMVLAVLLGVSATGLANAQEIQLTGPLAGAPAVRKLRLRRQHRFELSPMASFTLLDEYQRTILFGARATYNVNDWLGLGVWGGFGAVKMPADLSDQINKVSQARRREDPNWPNNPNDQQIDTKLTNRSLHPSDFKKQLASIDWMFAPQLTLVPFRGKLAIFQKIFVDTDIAIFGGPAFIGLTERGNCSSNCEKSWDMKSRTAISGTFGLGLNFYLAQWASLGVEWRAVPFAWNTGGFDNHGGGPSEKFPDLKVDEKDREFKFNMLIGVSLGIHFPTKLKSSE